MEKYSSFTDSAVGVNPFAQRPAKLGCIGVFVGIIRCCVALPVCLLLAFFDFASSCAAFLPFLETILRSVFVRPLCSVLLLVWLGVWPSAPSSLSPQQCRVPKSDSPPPSSAQQAAVLLCNYCGYADVLYLCSVGCPSFLLGPGTTSRSVLLALRTLARSPAALHAVGEVREGEWAQALQAARGSSLVVFAECAPTIGNSVLTLPGSITSLGATLAASVPRPHVAVLGLRHTGQAVPHVTGGWRSHAFTAAGAGGSGISGMRLPLGYDPQPCDGEGVASWAGRVRDALVATLKVGTRAVALDYKQHDAFLKAWAVEQSKAGVKAA